METIVGACMDVVEEGSSSCEGVVEGPHTLHCT